MPRYPTDSSAFVAIAPKLAAHFTGSTFYNSSNFHACTFIAHPSLCQVRRPSPLIGALLPDVKIPSIFPLLTGLATSASITPDVLHVAPSSTLAVAATPPLGHVLPTSSAPVATAPVPSVSPQSVAIARPVITLLSTIVGICVLIGSLLYKLPQIIRVVRRRSAAGISVLMYALETLGTSLSALYFARRAFPFSTYGEMVFIMIQNLVLLSLIVVYQRLPRAPALLLAFLYVSLVITLLSPCVSLSCLVVLQLCSIPILNLARVPQLILNYRRKSTGELSPITLGLQLLGNIARIFTTVAQVKDPLIMVSVCVATCFNTALFTQWLYYSRRLSLRVPPLSQ